MKDKLTKEALKHLKKNVLGLLIWLFVKKV